jgi:transcriptional regulator with XRE-family HTH domain
MHSNSIIQDRITQTRQQKGLTQKKLCGLADISPTQLSRIESGITETVSSDVLIKLAQTLEVSTDYLLGLTDIKAPMNYGINELGLSEGAVKALVSGKADINALNSLLENAKFKELLRYINAYFTGSISAGVMARNAVLDYATASLTGFANENPEHKPEVLSDVRTLRASKLGEHEVELERIKSIFVSILGEIKEDINKSKNRKPDVNAEMLQRIIAEAQGNRPKTIKEVARIVANAVIETAQLSENVTKDIEQFTESFIMSCGKER